MLSYKQSGVVAKRLGSGLQNRLDRFDSGPRLQMKYQGHRFDGLIFLPGQKNACIHARQSPGRGSQQLR